MWVFHYFEFTKHRPCVVLVVDGAQQKVYFDSDVSVNACVGYDVKLVTKMDSTRLDIAFRISSTSASSKVFAFGQLSPYAVKTYADRLVVSNRTTEFSLTLKSVNSSDSGQYIFSWDNELPPVTVVTVTVVPLSCELCCCTGFKGLKRANFTHV